MRYRVYIETIVELTTGAEVKLPHVFEVIAHNRAEAIEAAAEAWSRKELPAGVLCERGTGKYIVETV